MAKASDKVKVTYIQQTDSKIEDITDPRAWISFHLKGINVTVSYRSMLHNDYHNSYGLAPESTFSFWLKTTKKDRESINNI